MIISHNLTAANTQRMLGITENKKAKTTERLSSGYRINRSGDDAAGLTISEKMRHQIRGLTQAGFNAQDGISLSQVADGALNETHEMLHRMNELAIKAANGTNTSADCQAIQAEIDQLTKEINRIATETSFNAGIFPLNSGYGFPDTVSEKPVTVVNTSSYPVTCNGKTYNPGETFVIPNVLSIVDENNPDSVCSQAIFHHYINPGTGLSAGRGYFNPTDSTTPFTLVANSINPIVTYQTLDDVQIDENGYLFAPSLSSPDTRYYLSANQFTSVNPPTVENLEAANIQKATGDAKPITLQIGAAAEHDMSLKLVNATSRNLGVNNLDLSKPDIAGNAIEKIERAIEKVSHYRSEFGATHNRLEHTIANLNNITENLQAAESQIRDANMADEMVDLSMQTVLLQAGQSMLAQSNQQAQGVLTLLR